MITHADHVTVAVTDVQQAKDFFSLLGFVEEPGKTSIIEGEPFATYMHIPDLKAQHVTLVLEGAKPRFEIQLLHFFSPLPLQPNPAIGRLDKLGYNHLCFACDDVDAEIERLKIHGVTILSDVLDFHSRKLVYIRGPEGVVIELSQSL